MSPRDLGPDAAATSGRVTMFFRLLATLCALCLMFYVVHHHHHLNPISFHLLPTSYHQPSRQQQRLVGTNDDEFGRSEKNGWLLFAADSGAPSSSAAANKSRRGGYKWAAAPLLDDLGPGISAFELDEAATATVHNKSSQHDNRYSSSSSRTQQDLRETRTLHAEQAGNKSLSRAPTFKSAALANPIEIEANKSLLETSLASRNNSGDGAPQILHLESRRQVKDAMRRRRKRRAGNERGKPILNEFSFPANLVQGMRFVLMCQVLDGEPPIQIKWFKDNGDLAAGQQDNRGPQGAPMSSAGGGLGLDAIEMVSNDELGSSLLFRRVKQQHGGNYTCLASNHLGSASYSSLMTVKVPPSWHVEPQDQESIMGEQITIDCQATGNPNPFIRWKFASGIPFDKISQTSASLAADLLQGQAQGQLQATGTITSNQFKLINSNHHVQTLENGSLIIRQAAKEHEGLYLCEADNGVEPSLVKQMKLIVHKQVHFADDIQVILQQQQQQHGQPSGTLTANGKGSIISKDHVSASSTAIQSNQLTAQSIKSVRLPQNSSLVRLVCSPLGDAPIQLEWLKDGRLIHTHSSGPAPAGNNNEIVLAQDSPHETTSSPTSEHSSTIGRYHVSTRWSYAAAGGGGGAGSRAPVGLESELLLTNLNRHDAGLYTCAARNAFGQSERKLRLTVQEPPEPPTLVDVAHISSRAIALRWSAPFDGNSPILKYVIEYRRQLATDQQQQQSDIMGVAPAGRSEKLMPISNLRQSAGMQADPNAIVVSQLLASGANGGGGPQVQHTVHDLEPLTRYSMQVIAVNALGQSKPSVALSLRTEEEVPATVPNLVEAAVLSSRSIKLRWTISYALEHELIDGFFIGYRSFDATAAAANSPLLDGAQPPAGPPAPLDSALDAAGNPMSSASPAAAATNNLPKQFTYKTIRLTNQHLQPPDHTGDESGSARAAPVLSPVSSVTKLMPVGTLKSAAAAGNVKEAPTSPQEVAYVMSTFEHVIGGLERATEYTFLIQCFNKKGAGPTSDPVMAKTLMSDPPEKLALTAEDLSETSLRVSWHFPGETTLLARAGVDPTGRQQPVDPVDGFLLTFAKVAPRSALVARKPSARSPGSPFQQQPPPDSPAARVVQEPAGSGALGNHLFGGSGPPTQASQLLDNQWQAIQLAPQQRTHVLKQLECGSWYALKISAFNRVGKGEPSDLVTAATRGKAPLAPTRSHFLAINSTQVRLHLGAWHDGGCAIEKFIVQYRARASSAVASSLTGSEPWILVSNNIVRDQQSVLIRDLAPATTYELLVGAQNHVGLSEAKYRFVTLDSEGKQVVAGGTFLGGGGGGDLDEDSNSFVDYSDDAGVRRESYGNGPEGSMYFAPNGGGGGGGPARWLLIARQVLNSPLTLLLTFCVFLVLLGLLLFHRFGNQAARHHHQSHEANYHSGGGNSAAKLNSVAVAAPNHLVVGRCSIDGLATIIDGEPPLSSSSAATDSPARVNMTENGAGGGGSRLANGGYAPLDCYGGGTYCSGQGAPPSGDQQHYGAHQAECFAAPDNYTTSMALQQQQQQQQLGYYSGQQGTSIYGTTAGSHDQQCLMQMLLMSPGQQQLDGCASASALATMARQKAGAPTVKPMSSAYNGQNHLTLGRQLLDMQRAQAAAAAAAHHQVHGQQADSYQMSIFQQQQQQQDLISIYQEGAGVATNMSSSLASTSGCGTLAAASTSLSGQTTEGGPCASKNAKSDSCDSALDGQSCQSISLHTTQIKECDRTFQYDVPFNANNNMSHRALKLNAGSSSSSSSTQRYNR